MLSKPTSATAAPANPSGLGSPFPLPSIGEPQPRPAGGAITPTGPAQQCPAKEKAVALGSGAGIASLGSRPPIPLRPALLNGDRDWVIYVECLPEEIVLYPSRRHFSVDSLAHSSGHNPFHRAVRQMIERRQATVAPGDFPYRPEVRFLIHPGGDSERTFHLAHPVLAGLPLRARRQNLQPEDDVSAIIAAGR
jgi:hypothetical protein